MARFTNGASASIDPPREPKWLHAGAAAEPDWRVLGDPPSVGADFDAAPELIRQIEVDQTVMFGEAGRDFVLRTIELGLCLERQTGTANSSLTLRPSARGCRKRR